jgi:hypothetical protein
MLPLFNDLIGSVNVNSEEFVATALEGEFSQFDSQFHECSTPLQTRLEQYLDPQSRSFHSNCLALHPNPGKSRVDRHLEKPAQREPALQKRGPREKVVTDRRQHQLSFDP